MTNFAKLFVASILILIICWLQANVVPIPPATVATGDIKIGEFFSSIMFLLLSKVVGYFLYGSEECVHTFERRF